MVRSIFLFVCIIGINISVRANLSAEAINITVQAEAAILMNASTGAILYEKNSKKPLYPASITKIATAAYALEIAADKLLISVTVNKEALGSVSSEAKKRSKYSLPAYWLEPGGSNIGLKSGEEILFRDLLYAMLVASANDAANVIADSVGGSIPNFIEQLNAFLKRTGCHQTTFYNPHGLYHPNHVTTAYDMAILTSHAMRNPLFRKIVSTTRYVRPKTNKQQASVIVQTNRLLKPGKCYYPKAIGVKTGYIALAQNTLVAAAVQGNRMLIVVLLKCAERQEMFLEATKLFEAAFNQPKVKRVLVKAGETNYLFAPEGSSKAIKTTVAGEISMEFYPAEEPELNASLKWKNVTYPLSAGHCVGEITITTGDGMLLHVVPLLAAEDLTSTWGHWLKNIF
ncbi:MAG: D-alanyl-D-alanine carboxypeptidase [Parachlamydiaceae bacterium]|nr:D-alanyl-D-alanine carboxypeptidase [Parachlamydiaceae bacterium]